jgi:hypothetical protein
MIIEYDIEKDTARGIEPTAASAYVSTFEKPLGFNYCDPDIKRFGFNALISEDESTGYGQLEEKESEMKIEYESRPKKWTVQLQAKFDDLAAKYAIDETNLLEEETLAELISLRRSIKNRRTAHEVLLQIRREKKERQIISNISEYLSEFVHVQPQA